MNTLQQLDILRISGDPELISEIKEFFETEKSRRCKKPRELEFYRIKKANLLISFSDKWVYEYRDDHFYRYKMNDSIKVQLETLLNL